MLLLVFVHLLQKGVPFAVHMGKMARNAVLCGRYRLFPVYKTACKFFDCFVIESNGNTGHGRAVAINIYRIAVLRGAACHRAFVVQIVTISAVCSGSL